MRFLSETQAKDAATLKLENSNRLQQDQIANLQRQIAEQNAHLDQTQRTEKTLIDGLETILADVKEMQTCFYFTFSCLTLFL